MAGTIGVLIDASLHNELVLRTRKTGDVTSFIEHAIETFLDRTRLDGNLWSSAYLDDLEAIEEDQTLVIYGDPAKGYQWQVLFLPNGTNLRMTYKGRHQFADIRHGKLMSGDRELSPSEWARWVADNTNRNAWRDIWAKLPGSSSWQLADVLRQNAREALK